MRFDRYSSSSFFAFFIFSIRVVSFIRRSRAAFPKIATRSESSVREAKGLCDCPDDFYPDAMTTNRLARDVEGRLAIERAMETRRASALREMNRSRADARMFEKMHRIDENFDAIRAAIDSRESKERGDESDGRRVDDAVRIDAEEMRAVETERRLREVNARAERAERDARRRARESDELRALRKRLEAMETNAARAAQVEEKRAMEAMERARIRALDAEMDRERLSAETREADEQRTRVMNAVRAREQLEAQMSAKAEKMAARAMEKEEERRAVLAYQKRIEKEDLEDAREAARRRARAKEEAEKARQEQARRRQREKMEECELEESISKHESELRAREAAEEETKRHQEIGRAHV